MSESKKIYNLLKNNLNDPVFDHNLACPFCLSVSEVMKAGTDSLTFAYKKGENFVVDRWYCGSCDKHFYTDFKDSS